jgi:hypothetical protein
LQREQSLSLRLHPDTAILTRRLKLLDDTEAMLGGIDHWRLLLREAEPIVRVR